MSEPENQQKVEKAPRENKASIEELARIAKSISQGRKGLHIDHAELLYDEYGLPK